MSRRAEPTAAAEPIVADAAAGAIEVEWQLGAPNLARVRRWLGRADLPRGFAITPRDRVVYADAYLDTDDWSFHRAGVAVRLRRRRGRVEATIKALVPAIDGVARRREIVEALAVDPPVAVGDAPGPVGTRVRAVAGARVLPTLFVVRTSRRRFALRRDGVVVGEVTLDASAVTRASEGAPAPPLRRGRDHRSSRKGCRSSAGAGGSVSPRARGLQVRGGSRGLGSHAR